MPHVVTENCQLCRFTECVSVCPVDCFHADDAQLYIDPEVCIDCGVCVPACPVHAIYEDFSLPADHADWQRTNADRSRELPLVCEKQAPLPTAETRRAELGF